MNKNTKIKYQIIEAQLVELYNRAPNEDITKNLRKCLENLGNAYDSDGGQ